MKEQDEDRFWSEISEALRPRVPEAHWAAQRGRILSRLAEEAPAPSFAGWWRVPAFALASCAVYALCVELRSAASGGSPLAAALALHQENQEISTVVFRGPQAGKEELLAMLFEGAGK